MTPAKCKNPNCTVAETGICLELHKNLAECPNILALPDDSLMEIDDVSVSTSLPVDQTVSLANARQFHSGNELGTADANALTRKRYTHLIAILGSANVGKTCLLSSLYLLASQGELMPDYYFAGSLTLQGFEERVRRLRTWKGGRLPDQLVEHTRLQDPRMPAFMHLCVREGGLNGKFLDLLLTDLPGEWTDNLIDNDAAANHFSFLQRANAILYVIDGTQLVNEETKHLEIYRATTALDRVINTMKIDKRVPVQLIVSKGDEIDMREPEAAQEIARYLERYRVKVSTILTAAISRKPKQVRSGTGVWTAINSVIKSSSSLLDTDSSAPGKYPQRSFWRVPSN